MSDLSKASIKASAVLAVICVGVFASHAGKNFFAPEVENTAASFYQNKFNLNDKNVPTDEPTIAAANPVGPNSWTQLPNIKNGRFESSTIQYRDDIYVFNGFGAGINVEPTVEKFDAGTQTWSVISNTSVAKGNAVTHNGVIKHGSEVWMIGGRVGSHPGAVTAKVWKFNLITHKWSQGPQLPVPVAAGGGALVGNRIHWFGGLDAKAQCDVADHYVYDLNKPSAGWQNISGIAPMPVPRNHFATVVHEGLIYAIGGQFTHDGCGQGTPDTDLVHVFDPATNIWKQIASLPAVQSHIEPSTFVHLGAIYVVGGASTGNKVYRYDPKNDDWDTVAVLPQALLAPVARVIDGKLIVSSGGAPSVVPSSKTYTTDMAPLLLPGAVNTNDNSDVQPISDNSTVQPAVVDSNGEAGLITLEAEFHDALSGTTTHQWVPINNSGASNNAAMVTTPDSNSLNNGSQGSPSLTYFAHFDRPGTWYLWVRGSGDTVNGEGKSDSLHAGLNGSLANTADKIDNFPSGWNWTSSTRDGVRASLNIPAAGIHAVNLWMREDGLAVDKILLTTNSNYKPSGVGDTPTDNTPSPDNEVLTANDINTENESPADALQVTNVTTTASNATGTNTNTAIESTPSDSVENNTTESESTTVVADNSTQGTNNTSITTDNSATTSTDIVSNNGIVAIEVENFESTKNAGNKQWVNANQSGASGNASMVTTPDTGVLMNGIQGSPVMNYEVYFNEAGTYKVWLRGWGDTIDNEGKSDSAHVGINGVLSSAAAIQNFPSGWHWSSTKRSGGSATVFIPTSGRHTINIWMREDGLILDKLILAKNPGFKPSGTGPAVTSGAAGIADNPGASNNVSTSNTGSNGDGPTRNGDWVKCAIEHEPGRCEFSGTKTVAYGHGNNWNYQTHQNGVACNNATFGDPKQGTRKACYYTN